MDIKELAIKKAKQSPCRYRISAIGFDRRGKLIGSTYNKPRFNRFGGSKHAEIELIRKYGKLIKSMIICRVGNSGEILPIKLCNSCRPIIYSLGIKVVSIALHGVANG